MAPPFIRRRWRLLSCTALAATVVGIGCRDAFTGPSGSTPKQQAPKTARADVDPSAGESPASVTISAGTPDMWDGSAAGSVTEHYYYPTVVKATISGGVETYTPNFQGIGDAQTFTAEGRLVLNFTDDGSNFRQQRLVSTVSYVGIFGNATIGQLARVPLGVGQLDFYRTPLGTFVSCGRPYNIPCFKYGGDAGSVTLERVNTDLAVAAEFTDAKVGDTPYFDYRSSPQFAPDGEQLQWVVASSQWVPDKVNVGTGDTIVQGPGRQACEPQYDPACRREMKSSGTFTLSAYVNGIFKTKSVHVNVGSRKVVLELDKPGFIAPDLTFGNNQRDVWVSVQESDGTLRQNADVTLKMEAVDGSRGHNHTEPNRPLGTLPSSINTGTSGRVKVRYQAPDVAADIKVTGSTDNATDGTLTLNVGLTGFINIRAAMPNLTWNTPSTRHPEADWGLPKLLGEYQALSSEYLDWRQSILAAGYALPAGARLPPQLGTNDVSLTWGGRLDFKAESSWKAPHISHRQGYEGDWDVRRLATDDLLSDVVYYIWTVARGNEFGDERKAANHVHLKMSALNRAGGIAAVMPQSISRRATTGLRPGTAAASTDPGSSFWPRRDQLQVDVAPTITDLGSDKMRITYAVNNAATSVQPASVLVVRSAVTADALSGPDFWVPRSEIVADSSSFSWFGLGTTGRIAGGTSLTGFTVEATGLLGLVPYSVVGYAPNPSLEDIDTDSLAIPDRPSVWTDAARGVTVGVVPIPPGSTPASLGDRLGGLLDQLCALGWVDSKGVCNSLQSKLDAARSSLTRGNTDAARGQLGAFENEVHAQDGKHVRTGGAALLVQNAEAILRRL